MGNGMGSGTEMSAEREPGGSGGLLGVDHFLRSHISLLACGWKITYSGTVFSLTSCECENASALASPPGVSHLQYSPRTSDLFWELIAGAAASSDDGFIAEEREQLQ